MLNARTHGDITAGEITQFNSSLWGCVCTNLDIMDNVGKEHSLVRQSREMQALDMTVKLYCVLYH